jgi:hypothetical protein
LRPAEIPVVNPLVEEHAEITEFLTRFLANAP